MPGPRVLDGREYKLLLDPDSLGRDLAAIERFFDERLHAILARGKSRKVRGRFGKPGSRRIHFFDTGTAELDKAGYALRRRVDADGASEVTLKLRRSDLFVVAGTDLRARPKDHLETSFEEDIAPLEVVAPDGSLTIASPRSTRSRYALSVKARDLGEFRSAKDAFDLFPTFEENLRLDGVRIEASAALLAGPAVDELAFRGPIVEFDGGVAARVAISLWDLSPPALVHAVAEVSFRCPTDDGAMNVKAARAARDLFIDLQNGLAVEIRYPSKTKLALPPQQPPAP